MNSMKETNQRQSVIGAIRLTLPQCLAVFFAFGSLMSLGWLDNARGPIYPLILQDLGISHTQGGMFFALASFTAVVANFIVPLLLRYMSSLQLLLSGMVLLVFFPLAVFVSSTYVILLFSAIIFGFSLGIISVTQNIVVEESVPLHKKRVFLSLLHSTYSLSALMAPLLIGLILGYGILWNRSFLFILAFMLPVLILGVFSLIYNKSADFMVSAKEVQLSVPPKTFNLLLFWGLVLAFYISSELFFTTRLVVIFKELFGYSLQDSTFHLVFFFVGLFLGRLITGFLPSRFSGRMFLISSFALTCIWILLCQVFFPTLIYLVGFLMSPVFPIAMDEISNQSEGSFRKNSSLIIAFSSIGVVVMHILVGMISDSMGLNVAMYLPLVLCALALVACSFLWPVKIDSPSK